jgi:hypothetical protein
MLTNFTKLRLNYAADKIIVVRAELVSGLDHTDTLERSNLKTTSLGIALDINGSG